MFHTPFITGAVIKGVWNILVQILPGVRSNVNGVHPSFAGMSVGGMMLPRWPESLMGCNPAYNR